MFRHLRSRFALALLLFFISVSAHSSFHEWKINQLYSNADGTLQFIEMFEPPSGSPGQDMLLGNAISSNSSVFIFPRNLPNSNTAGKKFLIGTAGLAAASGVTPDYIMPDGFIFLSNVTINFASFDSVGPIQSVPTDGTLSLTRLGANSFTTATNLPTNFAGTTGTVVVPTPTPPGAPTNVVATPGNAQLTISFTPGSTGGSSITSFTATCASNFGSNQMATGTASPITVTGLSNGLPYLCSVNATNTAGSGPSGSASGTPVAPVAVPGAPTITSIAAAGNSATINFSPPASNGGAAISSYTANCGTASIMGAAPQITLPGLTNGTTYSCTVTATNSAGTGAPSAAMNVTPGTSPGSPTITSAAPGNAQATIAFTTPADGGSTITSYGVSCTAGQLNVTAAGPASPISASGLTNGANYSCSVVAFNSFGPGAPSAPMSVIPFTVPAAPTIGVATSANSAASIAFTPPANNGGRAISGYTATCSPGGVSATGVNSPINLSGLANGTVYSCSVTAANAAGAGAASAGVYVVPATVPAAPTIGTPVAGDGRAAVFFTPPPSNGGSPVVSYTASCGAFSASGAAAPITVTGLSNNNITYACSVIATNAVGSGAASATANVTPSAGALLTPIAVVARKIHGSAGTFDLPVDIAPAAVTVEPRTIGNGHTIVFQFNVPITATGTVTVVPVGSVSAMIAGADVVVTLTNVADNQRATITLANVNGAGVNVSATLGFLIGDVNNTRSVNASDIAGMKARVGQAATGANFRFDVNASGVINPADISAVRARSGLMLP